MSSFKLKINASLHERISSKYRVTKRFSFWSDPSVVRQKWVRSGWPATNKRARYCNPYCLRAGWWISGLVCLSFL